MPYDYLETVKKDVLDYISCEIQIDEFQDLDYVKDVLHEAFDVGDYEEYERIEYVISSEEAERNLIGNTELLEKAFIRFDCRNNINANNPHWCDRLIKDYLLEQAIDEVLQENAEEFKNFLKD